MIGEDSPILISGAGMPIKVSWSLIVQTTITLVALVTSVVSFRASYRNDIDSLKSEIVSLQLANAEAKLTNREILIKMAEVNSRLEIQAHRSQKLEEQLVLLNERLWNGRK